MGCKTTVSSLLTLGVGIATGIAFSADGIHHP